MAGLPWQASIVSMPSRFWVSSPSSSWEWQSDGQFTIIKLKNIEYNECQDTKTMEELDIAEIPVLQVGDMFLIYSEAVKWVNKQ